RRDEIERTVFLAVIVDRDDVGMLQAGDSAGFLLEAGDVAIVLSGVRWQHFDSNVAVNVRLIAFVDRCHAAACQQLDDLIFTKFPPNPSSRHESSILMLTLHPPIN